MKKVLFITNQYPPAATGGVFRSLFFTRNLEKFAWKPTVLTAGNKHNWTYDSDLLKKVPENIDVIRANEWNTLYLHILLSKLKLEKFYNFLENKFFIPDKKIGWLPSALSKGKKLLRSQNFDLIFSTSPSVCSHIIAKKLSKRYQIPWICEFRDLWTMLPSYKFKHIKRGRFEQKLEYSFLKESQKVILVSNTFKEQFKIKYPLISPHKFEVIYNGFEKLSPIEPSSNNQQLTITYTGSMYGNYYPAKLFECLKNFVKRQPDIFIKLVFVGRVDEEIKKKLRTYRSIDVKFPGFKTKDELPSLLTEADALLLFQMENYISIPSKVFEYLAYQKPILALVQDQELTEIVSTTGMAYCADPNNPEEIEIELLKLYKDWQHDTLPRVKFLAALSKYSRENQCQQLANIFNEVA